jgi:serine protease AprX
MRKQFFFLMLFACTLTKVQAQFSRYVIQFTDKRNNGFTLANPSAYLSAKSIERRTAFGITIDSSDLPITKAYIDSLRTVPGVQVLNQSKWFNQVLVRISDAAALTRIQRFPFVKSSAAMAVRVAPTDNQEGLRIKQKLDIHQQLLPAVGARGTAISYGQSAAQVDIHRGQYLHNQGFTGAGVQVAVLDAGFYTYKENPGSDSIRRNGLIKGVWDFVDNHASVNEDDPHGWYVFSMMAGNLPGVFVGTAPHASYYLLRTEDAYSEYPVEEQNWAAAAEYADSAGANIITSSLGYSDFDDPRFDHSYAERDGKTTLITRAANLAFKKGMIVTASAGNSGDRGGQLRFVNAPADGEQVFAVGAVDSTGQVASFSSYGPNSSGRVKPDIASVGWNASFLFIDGSPVVASGTSLSNPNVTGLIACLWQAFPEFSNVEILDAIKQSASIFLTPNARMGYGIPNFEKAFQQLATWRSHRALQALLKDQDIQVFPNPFVQMLTLAVRPGKTSSASIRLMDASGRQVYQQTVLVQENVLQRIECQIQQVLAPGTYYLQYHDGVTKQTFPVLRR